VERLLRDRFSELKSAIDEAQDPERGESVLDLLLGDQRVSVVWSAQRGFGVSSYADSEFGQRPDEIFESAADAAERIKSLFLSHTKTSRPAPADLAELRQSLGITQVALAKRMKVGQGAISKLEGRPDARLSTLEAYFKALGVGLQIVARTPRGTFPLRSLGTRPAAKASRRS
jgi:DNA-binding transcriptional regulator YiaG